MKNLTLKILISAETQHRLRLINLSFCCVSALIKIAKVKFFKVNQNKSKCGMILILIENKIQSIFITRNTPFPPLFWVLHAFGFQFVSTSFGQSLDFLQNKSWILFMSKIIYLQNCQPSVLWYLVKAIEQHSKNTQ